MEIGFLGGTQTVTGSKYLLHHEGTRVLIDCGLFQGLKALRLLNWEPFPFAAQDIQAVLLTHAHLDHCGALPLLVKQGFRGPIYCTPATLDLAKIILLDAAKIQEEEAEYANRKKFSKHNPARPLYTIEDAEQVFDFLRPVDLHQEFLLGHFRVTYRSSGHILGAASILVSSPEKSVYFSGDLGRSNDPLMWPPEPPPPCDALLMESTYGDRLHSPVPSKQVLKECILKVCQDKGVLLIPSFSVGRAQNILQEIAELKKSQEIPDSIPVHFNSPMGNEAAQLYITHSSFHRLGQGVFSQMLSQVHEVRTAEESKALNESPQRPMVIVAASGMLTGGRVLHHFKAFAGDPRNILLLAGFQAAGTRGRDLQEGKKEIKVHGTLWEVECQVFSSDSFSSHADQQELLKWLRSAATPPGKVFLTHGEPTAMETLAAKIRQEQSLDVTIPEMNSIVRV